MATADRDLAREWVEMAEQDLAVAEVALDADPPLIQPAPFHCQQAAEKALKAVLIGEGVLPPRTHDLTALWALAAKIANWENPIANVARLTDYAVKPRYPAPDRAYTLDEARTAVDYARAIVGAVREAL